MSLLLKKMAYYAQATAASPVVTLVYAGQSIGGGWNTITGSTTFSTTGTSAVVACFVGLAGGDQGAPTMTNGVTLTKQTASYNAFSSNSTTYGGFYLAQNVTAASHVITQPSVTGGNDGLLAVWAISNMPATVTVRTNQKKTQATSNQTFNLVSAGNVSVNDLAFGCRTNENSVGSTSAITPPSGWTSDAQYLNGSLNLPTDFSHFVCTSGGSTLSATWVSTDAAITDTSGAMLVLAPN